MKKILKFLLWTIGGLLALVLLLIATVSLWLGPVVKPTLAKVAPTITKTSVTLEKLMLNPYTGHFELGGLVIGNPAGYAEPVAASLGNLSVDVEMSSLYEKCIHVRNVTVEDLFVSYVAGGEHGASNFTQIRYNIAGGKEKFEANQAAQSEQVENAPAAQEPQDQKSEIKVMIDRLTVARVRVKLGPLTVPVPVDVTLTDIGKKSNGVTMAELFDQVWENILKSASAAGNGVENLKIEKTVENTKALLNALFGK